MTSPHLQQQVLRVSWLSPWEENPSPGVPGVISAGCMALVPIDFPLPLAGGCLSVRGTEELSQAGHRLVLQQELLSLVITGC